MLHFSSEPIIAIPDLANLQAYVEEIKGLTARLMTNPDDPEARARLVEVKEELDAARK